MIFDFHTARSAELPIAYGGKTETRRDTPTSLVKALYNACESSSRDLGTIMRMVKPLLDVRSREHTSELNRADNKKSLQFREMHRGLREALGQDACISQINMAHLISFSYALETQEAFTRHVTLPNEQGLIHVLQLLNERVRQRDPIGRLPTKPGAHAGKIMRIANLALTACTGIRWLVADPDQEGKLVPLGQRYADMKKRIEKKHDTVAARSDADNVRHQRRRPQHTVRVGEGDVSHASPRRRPSSRRTSRADVSLVGGLGPHWRRLRRRPA